MGLRETSQLANKKLIDNTRPTLEYIAKKPPLKKNKIYKEMHTRRTINIKGDDKNGA